MVRRSTIDADKKKTIRVSITPTIERCAYPVGFFGFSETGWLPLFF